MKSLIKILFLPVFLVASLGVFAKEASILGTWQAEIKPPRMGPAIVFEGLYVFDDAMVSPERGMALTAVDNVVSGAQPKVAMGSWQFVKMDPGSETVSALYTRSIKSDGKIIEKIVYTLNVKTTSVNSATGTLAIKKYSASGAFESNFTYDVKLRKLLAPQ